MAASTTRAGLPTRDNSHREVVRAAAAATAGSAIVWYDFFLYGFAAATVLDRLFFPSGSPAAGALLAVGTYAVGFAARPLGALLLGRLGDRIGRRATLIAAFLLLGLATPLIGLVPSYARIGIFGGILLVLLRIVQGIGMGGAWAGSVLLPVEWGQRGRRGFIGSWPQVGVPLGLLLAYGAFQLFTSRLGADAGWRVPFLLSVVLIGVAVYLRLGVRETPVYATLLQERRIEEAPLQGVLARQGRDVVLTGLARLGQQVPLTLFTVFVLIQATGTLKLDQRLVATYTLVAAGASVLTVPFWGFLSDVVGRKRLCLIGAAAMAAWSYPYWALLGSGVPALAIVAIVLSLPIHDVQAGPQPTLIAETFTGRLRYSGASLGYHLGSLIADAPAPLIAFGLLHAFGGSPWIAAYMIACAAISAGAVWLLRDRRLQDMSAEYDEAPAGSIVPQAQRAVPTS